MSVEVWADERWRISYWVFGGHRLVVQRTRCSRAYAGRPGQGLLGIWEREYRLRGHWIIRGLGWIVHRNQSLLVHRDLRLMVQRNLRLLVHGNLRLLVHRNLCLLVHRNLCLLVQAIDGGGLCNLRNLLGGLCWLGIHRLLRLEGQGYCCLHLVHFIL